MENNTTEETVVADEDILSPEDVLKQANDAQKDYFLSIFFALTQSERFNTFLEDNYEIQRAIDDETKTISVRVIEKPTTASRPQITSGQMLKLAARLSSLKIPNPSEEARRILHLLGEESSIITDIEGIGV